MSKKIQISHIAKRFNGKVVLEDVSLDLNAGESMVIIGGSGTGKSVFLKCILGLILPDAGQVLVDGQDLTPRDSFDPLIRLPKFGMLFQGSALFDSLTVWENIAFLLLQKKMPLDQAKTKALEKLRAVHLSEDVAHLYPAELSGGMQRRVALARAIVDDPEIVFFDEPTAGLDPIASTIISELIAHCVKTLGATAITITHDLKCARHVADRLGMLHEGRFIWTGSIEEMDRSDNPYLHQFLGGLSEGPIQPHVKG